jgi:hypothetical protein
MLEVAMFFVFVIAGCYVLSFYLKPSAAGQSKYLEQIKIPEDSVLRRHFITQLKRDIEANPSLHRHYKALLANEL